MISSQIKEYLSSHNTLNSINDRLKNIQNEHEIQKILNKLKFDSKDEAIVSMYQILKSVDILWSQMMALEVLLVYKSQYGKKSF